MVSAYWLSIYPDFHNNEEKIIRFGRKKLLGHDSKKVVNANHFFVSFAVYSVACLFAHLMASFFFDTLSTECQNGITSYPATSYGWQWADKKNIINAHH